MKNMVALIAIASFSTLSAQTTPEKSLKINGVK
jgi:hypothetical protein